MYRQYDGALAIAQRQVFVIPCSVYVRNTTNIEELNDEGLAQLLLYLIDSCGYNHPRRNQWNVRNVRER